MTARLPAHPKCPGIGVEPKPDAAESARRSCAKSSHGAKSAAPWMIDHAPPSHPGNRLSSGSRRGDPQFGQSPGVEHLDP